LVLLSSLGSRSSQLGIRKEPLEWMTWVGVVPVPGVVLELAVGVEGKEVLEV
jgi:hypothetical protein